MNIDTKMIAGILVGVVVGLHYHASLVIYLPVLTVATLIVLLKTIHR